MGAAPSGKPGCPEFAFSIASIERIRTAFTHKLSILVNSIGSVYPGNSFISIIE